MKLKHIFLILSLLGFSPTVFAEETIGEKTEATVNDAKRGIKKGYHRAKEKVCARGDVACLSEKAKHRGTESKDYIEDKAKELKNNVD